MIRISKKEALEQLQSLKESYGVDPIYIDEKAAKAFECLELYINKTLLNRKPLAEGEDEYIRALTNSCIDGWCVSIKRWQNQRYRRIKKDDHTDEVITKTRIILNFLSFMQSHGVDEFINYLECTDFFKEI